MWFDTSSLWYNRSPVCSCLFVILLSWILLKNSNFCMYLRTFWLNVLIIFLTFILDLYFRNFLHLLKTIKLYRVAPDSISLFISFPPDHLFIKHFSIFFYDWDHGLRDCCISFAWPFPSLFNILIAFRNIEFYKHFISLRLFLNKRYKNCLIFTR